jgi:hypothetical protein
LTLSIVIEVYFSKGSGNEGNKIILLKNLTKTCILRVLFNYLSILMGFFMPIKYLFVMGKRFIISESEKNDIRKMYGLILEQQRCDQWKNGTFQQGDGVQTPKITITKTPSLIEGLYEGPDKGGCIQRASFNDRDTPHQLAGILVFYEAAPYLKELYNQGIYVKPDMEGITMERVIDESFKISIPLIKTTENKSITSINERGGMGHGGDLTEISNIEKNPDHKLIEKRTISAGDMTETFIIFRNITKFPFKTGETKSQYGQEQQTNSDDLTDFK